jgi:hypothetical protein
MFFAASALAVSAASASAQPRVNPRPPADAEAPPPGANVLVGYIQQAYGVSKRQAEERVQIQGEIAALLENPAFSRDENFAGVVVENEPVYQVFLLYDDNDAKSELLKLVPPTLRKYVKIRKTRFSKSGRRSGEQTIQRALKAANVSAVVDYDQRGDVFVIQAPGADAGTIRGLLPAEYQDTFRLDTSPFPQPEQYTTGTAGRAAYAGYVLNPSCTLAFAVTYTYGGVAGRQGILSAGHCFEPADPDKSLDWADGARTVFVNPVWRLSQNSIDVAFLETTNMTTGYWINYDNPPTSTGGYANQVGGFATPQGWLRAKNFIRSTASWVGMSVCKQGRMTALTCGEVTSTSYPYTYFGDGRFVRVSNSRQQELSAPGDSGGPWFTSTVVSTSTDVSVLGIHITGAGVGTTAYALYMPIERVFALPAGGPTDIKLFLTP